MTTWPKNWKVARRRMRGAAVWFVPNVSAHAQPRRSASESGGGGGPTPPRDVVPPHPGNKKGPRPTRPPPHPRKRQKIIARIDSSIGLFLFFCISSTLCRGHFGSVFFGCSILFAPYGCILLMSADLDWIFSKYDYVSFTCRLIHFCCCGPHFFWRVGFIFVCCGPHVFWRVGFMFFYFFIPSIMMSSFISIIYCSKSAS